MRGLDREERFNDEQRHVNRGCTGPLHQGRSRRPIPRVAVAAAAAFYTHQLGFTLRHQQLPAFANVALGDVQLLLSGPGASGSRPMPTGEQQEPGGWNRIVLKVADLPTLIDQLKEAGLRFRNAMEVRPGGRQVQVKDPDGNPIELFEPAR